MHGATLIAPRSSVAAWHSMKFARWGRTSGARDNGAQRRSWHNHTLKLSGSNFLERRS